MWIHSTRTQFQKTILYSKTGLLNVCFKDFWHIKKIWVKSIFFDSDICLKRLKLVFEYKIAFFNLCSCAVNSQRLFCDQKHLKRDMYLIWLHTYLKRKVLLNSKSFGIWSKLKKTKKKKYSHRIKYCNLILLEKKHSYFFFKNLSTFETGYKFNLRKVFLF